MLNPGRFLKLADIAGKNLQTDQHTTLNGMRELMQRFRGFTPERFEAYIVPNHGIGNVDGISTVEYDPETANILFEAIADNESPADAEGVTNIAPSTVRVGVYNGSGIDGAAGEAAEALQVATDVGEGPVQIIEVTDARRSDYKNTVIEYEADAEKLADVLSDAIPNAELVEKSTPSGIDVEVIVGTRFETRQLVSIVPIPIPAPGEVPDVCKR